MLATCPHGGDDVVNVPWEYDTERHLTKVRGVRRPRRPTTTVEEDLAADDNPQSRFQRSHVGHAKRSSSP
jgi:hypothetical protein